MGAEEAGVSFREPVMLAGLLLVPLAALAYLSMQRRRRREAAAFANPALLPNLVTARPGWRSRSRGRSARSPRRSGRRR
jgi:hypothetical protein